MVITLQPFNFREIGSTVQNLQLYEQFATLTVTSTLRADEPPKGAFPPEREMSDNLIYRFYKGWIDIKSSRRT
jgi:hypothetical protein